MNKEEAAQKFYARLFEAAPSVKPMFTTDIKEQGKKLVSTLSLVVSKLDKLDTLADEITYLGKRHSGKYGAEPGHYPVVAKTLIGVLKEGNAEKWTNAHEEAWSTALNFVAKAMIEAGKK